MHKFIAVGAALAASVATAVAQNGSTAVQFSGIPQRIRTYQKPQQFQFGGNCPMAPQSYGNGIAPLDEEVCTTAICRESMDSRSFYIAVYGFPWPHKYKADRSLYRGHYFAQ